MVPKAPADGGVSTGNVADLDISFSNQPLTSLNNDAFGALFAQVTLKNEADLTLKGTADVTAAQPLATFQFQEYLSTFPRVLKALMASEALPA